MKLKTIFPLVLTAVSFIVGSVLYSRLPSVMVTHWGTTGQPNGFSSRPFGVYFLPVLLVLLYFLFRFLPSTDPYKKNFKQFQHYYFGFINLVFVFLFYLYVLTLIYNLGYNFDLVRFIAPAFAALFYYAGVLMANAKINWFVGIRTPWTLSSPRVWDKTHQLGGVLFKLVALLSLFGLILPRLAVFFILIPILGVTLALFVYSYVIYRQK